MADDKPEDAGLAPESGRAKRTPPTIDLEATEVSGETQNAAPASATAPDPEPSRLPGEVCEVIEIFQSRQESGGRELARCFLVWPISIMES